MTQDPTAPALGSRALFPDLEARAYLNHGGVSAPSRPACDAARVLVDDYARRGFAAFGGWMAQRARLKEKLATLVRARPEDLAFVPNTTRGVTDVALCHPWSKGDRVVVFQGEFPANVTPWQRAAALFDLEVTRLSLSAWAEGDAPGLAALEDTLRAGGVSLVAVSAVQFQTGLRMPLAAMSALCRAHGAALFVDAVQACGAVPVDVVSQGIDYLSCGSHKWLMGFEGAGFVYVHPSRVRALRPHVAGWLSHEDPVGFLTRGPGLLRDDRPIRQRADFLEGGNVNAMGLAALEASVDALLALTPEAIHQHVNRYHDALEPELLGRGFRSLRSPEPARRSCTLGVLPPPGRDVVALHASLQAQGFPCAIPDGVLRFTPHWPNSLDEHGPLLAAIDRALSGA